MGDVAMTVPILNAFAKQYPDVKITMVSRPFFKPLFAHIPNLEFYALDPKSTHKGVLGLWRAYRELKDAGITAFADLHNVLRSRIVGTLLARSGKRRAIVDKARTEKAALTRKHNKVFQPLPSIFDRHCEVFESLGYPIDLRGDVFLQKNAVNEKVSQLTGAKQNKWIGIAPFAQHQSKVYPPDLMQEVIDTLSAHAGYTLFLFGGGAKETDLLNNMAAGRTNVMTVAGKLSFPDELDLISQLDLMLSMDSGNGHLAALFGIPVVTLWGATHPYAGFTPFAQTSDRSLTADRQQYPRIPTSMYGNKVVKGYEDAMRTISPLSVVEKVNGILGVKQGIG